MELGLVPGTKVTPVNVAPLGDPMEIEVNEDGPVPTPCWIHFAVPAAQWWADITFT